MIGTIESRSARRTAAQARSARRNGEAKRLRDAFGGVHNDTIANLKRLARMRGYSMDMFLHTLARMYEVKVEGRQ